MRHLFLTVFLLSFCLTLSAQYYVRGDHNGWSLSNQLVQRTSLYGGSTYATVFSASFDQKFKITNEDWSNNWGAGYHISEYDKRWTIGANGADAIWKGSPSTYIAVVTENPANFVNQLLPTGIMTLSAPPIAITSVTQIGTDQGRGNFQTFSTGPQTINISLSSAKSAQENIYLRYSTNNWASSNWVLASGSGTSYSAAIPGQGNGTVVSYYVLTTTLTHPAWDLDNYPNLMTLAFDNNGGPNYSYSINISLAAEYLHFDAKLKNSSEILLSWAITMETNTAYFEIQHSYDGIEFKTIEKIKRSASFEYSFLHKTQIKHTHYYRLVQVDFDGIASYSAIRSVDIASDQVHLSPNPGFGLFRISGLDNAPYDIIVRDHTGREVLRTYSGTGAVSLDLSPFSRGIYFITVQGELRSETLRVVKL